MSEFDVQKKNVLEKNCPHGKKILSVITDLAADLVCRARGALNMFVCVTLCLSLPDKQFLKEQHAFIGTSQACEEKKNFLILSLDLQWFIEFVNVGRFSQSQVCVSVS